MRIYTYDPYKEKKIYAGKIVGSCFYTERKYKDHYMRIELGYGIQDDVLSQLMGHNVISICIKDEKGRHHSQIGEWYYGQPKDYGHGNQRFKRIQHCYVNPNQISFA